jgi:antitoxin component YwqK of YwqJK toxin-antitoxin module
MKHLQKLFTFLLMGQAMILISCSGQTEYNNSNWEDGSLKTIVIKENSLGRGDSLWVVMHYQKGTSDTAQFYKIEKYYSNDRIAVSGYYDSLGRRTGLWEEWYASGKKALEEEYTDGEREGRFKTWTPGGGRQEDLEYKKGRVVKDNIPIGRRM